MLDFIKWYFCTYCISHFILFFSLTWLIILIFERETSLTFLGETKLGISKTVLFGMTAFICMTKRGLCFSFSYRLWWFFISVFRHLCIYFWPHWVFAAARGGFSRSDEQGLPCSSGAQAPCCGGFCCRAQTLGLQASVVVARGFSCSVSCGIFPDQGLNWCFLQCKAGS